MFVSLSVKEAIDEASLYSQLAHQPDVAAQFAGDNDAAMFSSTLDTSFFNVFNQVWSPAAILRWHHYCIDQRCATTETCVS